MNQPKRTEELFLVRIWVEESTVDPPQWRALVTHVASKERRYFANYGELCEFLDRRRELA